MADILADVRRGRWRPPEEVADPDPPVKMPTLHVFASEWIAAREAEGLRPRTMEYLRWCLTDHLLPVFAETPLDRITVEAVDRYARSKAAQGKLSNGSVNKTIEVLAQVMAQAVEYGYVPAIRRRVSAGSSRRRSRSGCSSSRLRSRRWWTRRRS